MPEIDNESRKWLYQTLTSPEYGLNLGTPQEFDSLVSNNEESRRWLWDQANSLGLNVGANYEEFDSLINPRVDVSDVQQAEVASQPVTEVAAQPSQQPVSAPTHQFQPMDYSPRPVVGAQTEPAQPSAPQRPFQPMDYSPRPVQPTENQAMTQAESSAQQPDTVVQQPQETSYMAQDTASMPQDTVTQPQEPPMEAEKPRTVSDIVSNFQQRHHLNEARERIYGKGKAPITVRNGKTAYNFSPENVEAMRGYQEQAWEAALNEVQSLMPEIERSVREKALFDTEQNNRNKDAKQEDLQWHADRLAEQRLRFIRDKLEEGGIGRNGLDFSKESTLNLLSFGDKELREKLSAAYKDKSDIDGYMEAYYRTPEGKAERTEAVNNAEASLQGIKERRSSGFWKTVGAMFGDMAISGAMAEGGMDYQSQEQLREVQDDIRKTASVNMAVNQQLHEAENTLGIVKKNIEEGEGNAFVKLGRGVRYSNLDNLIPVSELYGQIGILQLYDKLDANGNPKEPLTEEEQNLYEALAMNQYIQQAFGSDVNMLNRIGRGLPEQAAFTLQFLLSSEFAGAQAIGKGATNALRRGIGKAVKKEIKSGIGRFMLDKALPTAFGMGAETLYRTGLQLPSIMTGGIERHVGKLRIDPETGKVGGFENGVDWGEALWKSTLSVANENFTELLGDQVFQPGWEWLGRNTKAGTVLSDFREGLGRLGNNKVDDWLKAGADIRRKAGWAGWAFEAAEEMAGSFNDAAFIHDHTWSEAFSKESVMETVLNCMIFGVVMGTTTSTLGSARNLPSVVETRNTKRKAAAVIDRMEGISTAEIDEHIDNSTSNELADWLVQMHRNGNSNGDWTDAQRTAVANYVRASVAQKAQRHFKGIQLQEDVKAMEATADDMVNNQSGDIIDANFVVDGQQMTGTIVGGRVSAVEDNATDAEGNQKKAFIYNPNLSSVTLTVRLEDGTKKQIPARDVTSINDIVDADQFKAERAAELQGEMQRSVAEMDKVTTASDVWSKVLGGRTLQAGMMLPYNGGIVRFDGKDADGNWLITTASGEQMSLNDFEFRKIGMIEGLRMLQQQQAPQEEIDDAVDDIDTEDTLHNIEQSDTEDNIWDNIAGFMQGYVKTNEENDFVVDESRPEAAAGYLVALQKGDIAKTIDIVNERIAELQTRLGEKPQGIQNNGEGVVGMAANQSLADSAAEDIQKQIDFLTAIRDGLVAKQLEKAEMDAMKPVSQMGRDESFPVVFDGQQATAVVREQNTDGNGGVLVDILDENGDPIPGGAGYVASADELEGMRVRPQEREKEENSLVKVGDRVDVDWGNGTTETVTVRGIEGDLVLITTSDGKPYDFPIGWLSSGQARVSNNSVEITPAPQGPAPAAPSAAQPVSQNETPEPTSQQTPTPVQPEAAPQQEQPQAEYPKDKQGKPQYDLIEDPNVFLQALVDEWGEDALGALDDIIEDTKEGLDLKSKLEQRRINKRLAMLEAVRGMLQPQEEAETPAEQPVGETPAEEAPKEEAPAETPMEEETDLNSDTGERGVNSSLGYDADSNTWTGVPDGLNVISDGKANRNGIIIGYTPNTNIELIHDTKSGVTSARVWVEDELAETPALIISELEKEVMEVESGGEGYYVDFDTYEKARRFEIIVRTIEKSVHSVQAIKDAATESRVDEPPMESAGEGTEVETPSETTETPIQKPKPKKQSDFQQRIDAVGEPRSLEEAILLDIARGGAKFRWGNRDEDKTVTKRGIGDLWKYSQSEFKKRIGILRKDGYSIETYAEAIQAGQLAYLGGHVSQLAERMDMRDLVDAIEDVLHFATSATEALEAIETKRNEEAEEEQRMIQNAMDSEAKEQGFENWADKEAYIQSLEENNLTDDDYDEITRIFAEQYQEDGQRARTSESEGDSAENQPDEQQGVRGADNGSTEVLQGTQAADTGTTEPAGQGTRGESGDIQDAGTPGKNEGAREVRAEIDKLKAQRANLVKQLNDLQKRYENANGLFGDTQADEGDLFGGQNFLSPELAQTTIEGYKRQIKQIDEQIAKLEASLKRASSVKQTEIGGEETKPQWDYDIKIDQKTGHTTIERYTQIDGGMPIFDARWKLEADSPAEMLGIITNPRNGLNVDYFKKFIDILRSYGDRYTTKKAEPKKEEPKKNEPQGAATENTIFTEDEYQRRKEALKRRHRTELNIAINPQDFEDLLYMAGYHIERGVRKFADFCKSMIEDLGDWVRPYLQTVYLGAKADDDIKKLGIDRKEWSSEDEVLDFDVDNFDKQQESETGAHQYTDQQKRKFSDAVRVDMRMALERGEKPYRSINDIRKRAESLGMEVDSEGRDDIVLQELVEDGLVRAAREVVESGRYGGIKSKDAFDAICQLYEMQPTISRRSANRVKMQQYSTPLPMSFVADMFAYRRGQKSVLEPTAGNGMLVFAVPAGVVTANELDETRLANLREQGFDRVLNRDATDFDFGGPFDAVIGNPPFGSAEAKEYDGVMIGGLEEQIVLNALQAMADNGRAAFIVGGNMEYAKNGGIAGNKAFWTYLYNHYNVKGVVDMDGKMFSRQGTTFPTRMILIDGRRSAEEIAQSTIYPPVKEKSLRKAENFVDLYDIVKELNDSTNKTNGTEILRTPGAPVVPDSNRPSGETSTQRPRVEPNANVANEQGGPVGTGSTGGTGQTATSGVQRPATTGGTVDVGQRPASVSGTQTSQSGSGTRTGNGERGRTDGNSGRVSDGSVSQPGNATDRVGLTQQKDQEKRTLTEEKLPYRKHSGASSLESVAPAAMVEAMDRVLSEIEKTYGKSIDEFVREELGYDTDEELYNALAAEQIDSVAMAIHQMKQGNGMIIGDQTGVGKGRQMAALIRWAHNQGKKPVFITQKADLFTDIYRDIMDVGSGDLKPFIFNSDGAIVDSDGNVVHKPMSPKDMAKVFEKGELPDGYDYAVLTYSQVNTGDSISQEEAKNAAKASGKRGAKKSKSDGKPTPKATFLRQIAEDNYLFLDESHTAAGESNTGYYLQSIVRTSKAVTFASATFAKRPDTMPLYAIRTAMSQANVKPNELIGIIQKGGVTLQEIMSRALTEAGQMVRRERDMSDVQTDWETISDPATVKRARENYDKTIEAFNAIIRFQELYIKPLISQLDSELAEVASTANVKKGTNKMGVENTPFASKTYNYTKQLMLALKVDAIVDKVIAEIKAGRHPVIALESTMEASIRDYSPGDIISEPTFSASLLRGLETVMQYTVTDAEGKDTHRRYLPSDLGPEGEKAYYELQDFIRESTSDIFISPLDAIVERLRQEGYKVGELTGRNQYVERNDEGKVVVKRRTDKDKKRMQREFNSGELDVLILNKSASTGISLHASERFSDQRQRTMVIAQPLSDINDYMQMIGRIDRTGQVHRGYYINLGLPVPAENRFLMMLATKLKSLNANTTTSQESESNSVEAPDLLNKYGSQVVVEYLRDNPEIYVKMGEPIKEVTVNQLDDYTPPENDEVVRKITGYVALLSTKEQEDFYNDVVRRYIDLIKYLDDTGQNDLKITVMPLRAKTIERRVSSQGVDPNGTNPFAKDAFVETVEIDVLRKPMKADEVRKTIESLNTPKGIEKGHLPTEVAEKSLGERVMEIIGIVQREAQAKLEDEERRYEESKEKAAADIEKQREKISKQQKRTEAEKAEAIAKLIEEKNAWVEKQHENAVARIREGAYTLISRLNTFRAGQSVLMPDVLEQSQLASPELASPAIFCGFKAKDSKVTASTTFAVFATLDGRRRIEIKLSDGQALYNIRNMANENYDLANRVTLDNWDSEIPSSTRKNAFILTGNILQAVADTQDQNGNYPGQLISYTDMEGDVHDGILMPDKWKPTMMKNSGVPINARLSQIEQGKAVASTDGKVTITKSRWSGSWLLTVPKSKKEGAVYFENPVILKVVGGFWQSRGQFAADINSVEDLRTVVNELANIGVKVSGEQNGGVELSVSNNDRSSIENTESQRIAFEAATTALARAGYEVVRATEKDIEKLKKENKLLRKINGTINGWLGKDGKIYLTDTGMNAETAVHEYTHLWAEALQLNDPKLWDEIKSLLKGTPTWNEVKNNPAYSKYDEDRLAEEVLAHLSGRDNGERMEAEAKRMIDEADTMADAAKAASMLNQLKEALKKFWTWVGNNLFGIKGKIDLDTVENMILADLVNGVNPFGPSGGRRRNSTEQSFTPAQPQNSIADEYNRMTGANVDGVSDKVRIKEELLRSFFDGLRPLEQMEKLIAKTLKRELRDSEKAYELATQTSSVSADMLEREETERLTPMIDKFTNMVKWLMDEHGLSREEAQEKANNYMLAKHGLERNAWFEKQGKDEGDYAGLTGLAESIGENPDDYKAVAENIVSEFERMVGNEKVNEFWATVNDFTNRMLEISKDSGMIDKDTFEDLQKRHKYYIPLRGFADGTASDLFDYITKAPQFQDIFKKAKGRKSKADDPLSNLYNMMQSAIVIGNQNKVMQSIYRLAVNSNSDLLRITKPWYVYNDATKTWEEKFPDIPEGATADETDAIVKQFEADMAQLKANGKAKRKLNRLDVGKRMLNREKVEHRMIAYIDGQRVAMFVNGNPLVAQALNRANTNQLGVFAENMQVVTRIVSMINTSLSPAFMLTNSPRDIGFALFSAMVTGGFKKTGQMAAWMATSGWVIPRLIATGKLDAGLVNKIGKKNADQIAQWWQEFTQNGGETGFMKTLSAEKARAQVNDMITHMLNGSKDGKNRLKKATLDVVTTAGRWSEDISRFAAYCWSRSQGNSVMESVNEAKNVTVNFNVKGGGNSTIARAVAGCRACFSFFNAALQGINRMARLAKEHPKAFATCLMACVLQGFLLPWINMLMFTLLGGDDDDWEKYKTLTEYTANHNFVLYVGDLNPFKKTKGKFIKIPYSQELAPFAAMGNIFFRQQMGWNNGRSVADQIASMFIDLSPVSVGESKSFFGKALKTVTPTLIKPIVELGLNEDFTASPIYKKNQWNKYDAGWEKAYENKTPGWLIDGTRWLEQNTNGWVDINPAAVEHLFSGMLGGIGRSGDKLVRFVSNGFQLQDAPFIRTMMFDSNPKGYIGAVQREYGRNAYEVLPEMKAKVEKADALEFARLVNTEEYQIANMVSIYKTGKDLAGNKMSVVGIDKMEKEYKKMAGMSDGSEEYREQLEAVRADITEAKMQMLDEIQQIKYENSGDLRRYIMDVVKEVERKSKEKNGD